MPEPTYQLTGATVRGLVKLKKDFYRSSPDLTGGAAAPRSRPVAQYFWGVIVTAGPNGEKDYDDERYWIQRVQIANNGGQPSDSITTTTATGVTATTITATNLPDLLNQSRSLRPNDMVRVWWEYDATSPTPDVRYMISQTAPPPILVRIDHDKGDGTYTGPILFGSANLAANADAAEIKTVMTAGTTQCNLVSIAEIPASGGDGPQAAVGNRLAIGSYASGQYIGLSADTPPVPELAITGIVGRIASPKDLPVGAWTADSGWQGNTATWDWATDAKPFTIHPMTGFGYDGQNATGSAVVTNFGARKLWFVNRAATFDALGHANHVNAEPSAGGLSYITLQPITVIIDVSLDGSGNLQTTTQTVYVIDYDQPNPPTTVVSGCP